MSWPIGEQNLVSEQPILSTQKIDYFGGDTLCFSVKFRLLEYEPMKSPVIWKQTIYFHTPAFNATAPLMPLNGPSKNCPFGEV